MWSVDVQSDFIHWRKVVRILCSRRQWMKESHLGRFDELQQIEEFRQLWSFTKRYWRRFQFLLVKVIANCHKWTCQSHQTGFIFLSTVVSTLMFVRLFNSVTGETCFQRNKMIYDSIVNTNTCTTSTSQVKIY